MSRESSTGLFISDVGVEKIIGMEGIEYWNRCVLEPFCVEQALD
jgi:hypothetical protein